MAEKQPYLVTRNDAAVLLGVTGPAISQRTKSGGSFDGAKVANKINMSHPAILAYAERKGIDIQKPRKDSKSGMVGASGATMQEKYGEWTLNKIIAKFGTDTGFKTFLDAVKTIEDIETRRINNAKSEGELIPRSLVEKYVFGPMSTSHTQLLQDLPKALAITTRDAYATEKKVPEVEVIIREKVSQVLTVVKRKAKKAVQ